MRDVATLSGLALAGEACPMLDGDELFLMLSPLDSDLPSLTEDKEVLYLVGADFLPTLELETASMLSGGSLVFGACFFGLGFSVSESVEVISDDDNLLACDLRFPTGWSTGFILAIDL